MSIGDTNFPIPSPDFLFVHRIEMKIPVVQATDSRGVPDVIYSASEIVNGYMTAPDPNNEDSAGTERIRYAATLLLPRTFQINEAALIRCTDPQLPPNLAGTYKVEVVRANISHTRCLLVRYAGPWEENTEV